MRVFGRIRKVWPCCPFGPCLTLIAMNDGGVAMEETIKEKGKKAVTVAREIPLSQVIETKVLISFK